jgi:hypothetical protein
VRGWHGLEQRTVVPDRTWRDVHENHAVVVEPHDLVVGGIGFLVANAAKFTATR